MTILDRQRFVHLFDEDSKRVFDGLEFRKCYFEGCALSMTRAPGLRSTLRNVRIVNGEQRGCAIAAAIVDNVEIDGLKTNGLLQCWAAVFRHVTLRGKIGRVMFSSAVAAGLATKEEQRAFDEANSRFYESVDWALDLTEAEFDECDLRGVPARLIRRDPATQFLVTREAAISRTWHEIDLAGTYWPTALDFFIESQAPDIVLVAPKRNRNFKLLLEGLRKLRECGVAEPS